jgi:hypothetical protein
VVVCRETKNIFGDNVTDIRFIESYLLLVEQAALLESPAATDGIGNYWCPMESADNNPS